MRRIALALGLALGSLVLAAPAGASEPEPPACEGALACSGVDASAVQASVALGVFAAGALSARAVWGRS